MNSQKISESTNGKHMSRLLTAIDSSFGGSSAMSEGAQFGFKAVVETKGVELHSDAFDMEFDIPFDDDLIANEAEIIIYNITYGTANKFKIDAPLTITAGYGSDTGIIFNGFVSDVKTYREGVDLVTVISALDDIKYTPEMMKEKTYSKGTKASTILKDLLDLAGIPVEKFTIERDYTYDDETKVDGNIVDNIKMYSEVCGVSTYIYKQRTYCRPIGQGDEQILYISSDTGMIESPEPFEEESQSENYIDIVKGINVNMLLQHQVGVSLMAKVDSIDHKGVYRIQGGVHSYDGLSATTSIKCIGTVETKFASQEK